MGYGSDGRVDCFALEAENLRKALEKKTNETWIVLVKLHPMAMLSTPPIEFTKYILNATLYPNMQELLIESNLLVTDYSSCMFDFMLKKSPCFIFATDIEDYKKDRNFYFELETLPFPLAKNNEELLQNIEVFDFEKMQEKATAFSESLGLNETGRATEFAVQQIEKWMDL